MPAAAAVRDAGVSLLGLGAILTVWCLIGVGLVVTGGLPVPRPARAVAYLVGHIAVFYLPMAVLGRLILARRRWALAAGTVLAVVFFGWMVTGGLLGFGVDSGGLVDDPGPRAGDILLTLLVGVQCAVLFIAGVAATTGGAAGLAGAAHRSAGLIPSIRRKVCHGLLASRVTAQKPHGLQASRGTPNIDAPTHRSGETQPRPGLG